MANEILLKLGSAISFTSATTPALTLTSLAVSAGRVAAQKDLGATHARIWRVRVKTKFALAPTEGKVLEVWLATSDNTIRDGNVGATDAALPVAADRFQMQFCGAMYCRAVTTQQVASFETLVSSRYVSPCVFNSADQALSGTAGDHEVILEPYIEEVQ